MVFKEDHSSAYCFIAPAVNTLEGLGSAASSLGQGGIEAKTLGPVGGLFKGLISIGLPVYTIHTLPLYGPIAALRGSWSLKDHYSAIGNQENAEAGATAVGWGIITLALTHPEIYLLPIEKIQTGLSMIAHFVQNLS